MIQLCRSFVFCNCLCVYVYACVLKRESDTLHNEFAKKLIVKNSRLIYEDQNYNKRKTTSEATEIVEENA